MDKKVYTKLSALVDDDFTVERAWGYKFKKWSEESGSMLTSDTYQQGYQKRYSIDTDKGNMEISSAQLGNMLEGVYKDGAADITGKTFHVKSNGKTGMEIRYYINPVYTKPAPKTDVVYENIPDDIDINDVPF